MLHQLPHRPDLHLFPVNPIIIRNQNQALTTGWVQCADNLNQSDKPIAYSAALNGNIDVRYAKQLTFWALLDKGSNTSVQVKVTGVIPYGVPKSKNMTALESVSGSSVITHADDGTFTGMTGGFIYLNSGTNAEVGIFKVLSVNAAGTEATLDRDCDDGVGALSVGDADFLGEADEQVIDVTAGDGVGELYPATYELLGTGGPTDKRWCYWSVNVAAVAAVRVFVKGDNASGDLVLAYTVGPED